MDMEPLISTLLLLMLNILMHLPRHVMFVKHVRIIPLSRHIIAIYRITIAIYRNNYSDISNYYSDISTYYCVLLNYYLIYRISIVL